MEAARAVVGLNRRKRRTQRRLRSAKGASRSEAVENAKGAAWHSYFPPFTLFPPVQMRSGMTESETTMGGTPRASAMGVVGSELANHALRRLRACHPCWMVTIAVIAFMSRTAARAEDVSAPPILQWFEATYDTM